VEFPVQQISSGYLGHDRALAQSRRASAQQAGRRRVYRTGVRGVSRPWSTCSVARRIIPTTTCARVSSSRHTAFARIRPPETVRHFSAPICSSTGSCRSQSYPCESSKATRFVDRLWSCCAPGWPTDSAWCTSAAASCRWCRANWFKADRSRRSEAPGQSDQPGVIRCGIGQAFAIPEVEIQIGRQGIHQPDYRGSHVRVS
jgi:hypothetical protein